jgi:hypothetical protein
MFWYASLCISSFFDPLLSRKHVQAPPYYQTYLQSAACAEAPHFALEQNSSLVEALGLRLLQVEETGKMAMNISVNECAEFCTTAASRDPSASFATTTAGPIYFSYGEQPDGENCCTCPGKRCTRIEGVTNSTVYVVVGDPVLVTVTPTQVGAGLLYGTECVGELWKNAFD